MFPLSPKISLEVSQPICYYISSNPTLSHSLPSATTNTLLYALSPPPLCSKPLPPTLPSLPFRRPHLAIGEALSEADEASRVEAGEELRSAGAIVEALTAPPAGQHGAQGRGQALRHGGRSPCRARE